MTRTRQSADEIRSALLSGLTPPMRRAIDALVKVGAVPTYVAGGAVRDALLGRPLTDVDVVTSGDAIDIARRAFPGAALTTHERFRTASVQVEPGWLDVATARRETYAHPGALPDVTPATIEDDLARRDFSVNAMAMRLDGGAEFVDPCGGATDLEARVIRVLHQRSFEDDATRIFRAYRYAARLAFAIDGHTQELIASSIRYIETIGGERLRREIELLLLDENGGLALEACSDAGALGAIHPALRWTSGETNALSSGAAEHASSVAYRFALLARYASPDDARAIIERLRLHRDEARAVEGIASMRDAGAMLARPNAKPSGVVAVLDRYPIDAVAAFAAGEADSIAGQLALRYLEEWRHEKPILTGDDLRDLGVPQGPQLQRGLQLIRAARLDGWAHDRADEQALALRFVKSIRDSDAMNQPLKLDLNGN